MKPLNLSQLQDYIRQAERVVACGSGSKPALTHLEEGVEPIDLTGFCELIEYQADEFTFTAQAGARLADIQEALEEHGQYLPFDPPMALRGATLGGTVASGLSGAGRYRYGGLRDFLLGVRFINGQGQLIRAGGKVVKNAAGFDLPKLMIGSLGQYGLLVELSFKVFPRPPALITLRATYSAIKDALDDLIQLTLQPLELFALELESMTEGTNLYLRLGGKPATFPRRIERAKALLHCEEFQLLEDEEEKCFWQNESEFSWLPDGHLLVKIPMIPGNVLGLEERLAAWNAPRRYSGGATLAWVAWPKTVGELDDLLAGLGLSGLVVIGPPGWPLVGTRQGEAFARRVKAALDPEGKFPTY